MWRTPSNLSQHVAEPNVSIQMLEKKCLISKQRSQLDSNTLNHSFDSEIDPEEASVMHAGEPNNLHDLPFHPGPQPSMVANSTRQAHQVDVPVAVHHLGFPLEPSDPNTYVSGVLTPTPTTPVTGTIGASHIGSTREPRHVARRVGRAPGRSPPAAGPRTPLTSGVGRRHRALCWLRASRSIAGRATPGRPYSMSALRTCIPGANPPSGSRGRRRGARSGGPAALGERAGVEELGA
uniref:Uncharacterized protein n=1 Tax=Setaria italica TaxID=4555 RepID=K4AEI3_SETIT